MAMASPNTQNSSVASEEGSNATLITHVATWSANHSEGGYDYELLDGTDSRYECPICLLCLRDPVLTTCGHRFCSSCISQWVIKENGKCPVDSVSLSHENIFPDNFTRREIMQSMAKCPYSKEKLGCKAVLPIAELEKHIQTDHISNNIAGSLGQVNGASAVSSFNSANGLLECPYKEVGCAIPLRQEQMHLHLEKDVHHHLQLLTAAYKRLKIYSSRTNLEYPGSSTDFFLRQDSRDSGRWLLDESLSPEDYQFRRQRSWDSVRFARKHNIRPSNLNSAWLPESDESLCHSQCQSQTQKDPKSEKLNGTLADGMAAGGPEPHLPDIVQRLVLLEQKDREKQIKIDKLEAEHALCDANMRIFTSSARIINDFTARNCNGAYVWKIPKFKKLCLDMRRNPNRVLNSPGFYTDTFGYELCLRFNLTTPSSSSLGDGASPHGVPIDVPLEQDEDTFISLYVHFMQGEFDDTLHWPFHGEMKLMVIHPTIVEDSVVEIMFSKPEAAAFAKPTLPRNPKGFGYPEFCPIHKIFSNGFLKNDTLTCKIIAKPSCN